MRFVSFHVQTGGAHPHLQMEHAAYLRLLEMMVRSVRRFHPGAAVTVLTDAETDLSALRVDVQRENHAVDRGALMLSRAQAQWQHLQRKGLDQPVLFLDTDMLINGNLEHLLEQDFDVALTVRGHAEMPVNGGFLLLNHQRPQCAMNFFERYLQRFRDCYGSQSAWYGDQRALADAVDSNHAQSPAARLLLLPCERYNHTPGDRLRKALKPREQCRILHFKGSRKRLMPLYWHAHLAGRPRVIGMLVWAVCGYGFRFRA